MTDHQVAIAMCQFEREASGRWGIAEDMNCDGLFTISDVWLWLEWVFFLPGDALLWALMQWHEAAIFFELTPENYGGWLSGIVSALGWLIVWHIWRRELKAREKWERPPALGPPGADADEIAGGMDWLFEKLFLPFKYAFRRWRRQMYWTFVLALTACSIFLAATNKKEDALILIVLAALFGLFGLVSHLDELKARKKWARPPDVHADEE